LHEVRLPGFGWLAQASQDERGEPSLEHGSWLSFLRGVLRDARGLRDDYPAAAAVSEAAAGIDAHVDALAAVEVGSLCHGDLKPAHVLVDGGRLAGVIDWGDAAFGDPLWDIARFAQRVDAGSISTLLEGYDPERALLDELAWRGPLYGALWMLVDASVDHRLGRRADVPLEKALGYLARSA
jgi:Ser/Thr protein kinase RdoA (MazF antagonist)